MKVETCRKAAIRVLCDCKLHIDTAFITGVSWNTNKASTRVTSGFEVMRWKWIWKIGMDMDRGGCWSADLPEGWGVALAIFHLGWCGQGGLNLVACLDGINDHAWRNCLLDNQLQPPFHQQHYSCQFLVRILRLFSIDSPVMPMPARKLLVMS